MAPALKQFATIKPFFNAHDICVTKETIRSIERKKLTYDDYSQRTGIIWSDFWVETKEPEIIKECKIR